MRLEEINLNLLLALDALLLEQNVTRAAKRLGVTQSAMSRSLASLRALLNDELLVRIGNEMRLTPYATSIQSGLRSNMSDLQRLVRTAGPFDPANAKGTLRIAAPGHIAALIAPALINRLQEQAPNLQLRIEQLDAAEIVNAIGDGVDLALGPMLDLGSAVQNVLIYRDEFACLVSADHPDVPGDHIDLETYLRCCHLLISPTGRGVALADEQLAGRRRRIVAEVESFLLAPAIIAKTRLILTGPRSALIAVDSSVKVVTPPFELPPMSIAAYWDPSRNDDARVRWALQSIRDSLQMLAM